MNKFLPSLLLAAAGMYFWWSTSDSVTTADSVSTADSVPSEIFTTWRTGTEYRLLTLYQGTLKNVVDGYFYNSKSGRLEGMVRSTYRDSILTGHWFQATNTKKCPFQKYGSYHWGKFRLNFNQNSFKGQWSYCDEELGGSWNGLS